MFYWLHDPLSNSAFRGNVDDVALYGEMELAKLGRVRPPQVPLIRHSMGRKLCDFIWVSLAPIIHQRVADLLTLSGVTGWATYPVQVFDRQGAPVPGYHGLSITGRCQSIFVDPARAEVVYDEFPGGRFPYYKGLHVTTDSWDGSDIFTPADHRTAYIVVTDKVKDLFVKARVANVLLTPASEVKAPAEDQPSFPKAEAEAAGPDRPQ